MRVEYAAYSTKLIADVAATYGSMQEGWRYRRTSEQLEGADPLSDGFESALHNPYAYLGGSQQLSRLWPVLSLCGAVYLGRRH
jgi:hypothetical protein